MHKCFKSKGGKSFNLVHDINIWCLRVPSLKTACPDGIMKTLQSQIYAWMHILYEYTFRFNNAFNLKTPKTRQFNFYVRKILCTDFKA